MNKYKMTHKLAAALTAGMLLTEGTNAFANAATTAGSTTFDDVGKNIITASGSLPMMIQTVAYVGGIGLGVAGVFKLKQHVDNPGQTPMKDGLVRLGAGGGLLALPYLTTAMLGSVAGTGTSQAAEGTFSAPSGWRRCRSCWAGLSGRACRPSVIPAPCDALLAAVDPVVADSFGCYASQY
jgi:hypothetical protein